MAVANEMSAIFTPCWYGLFSRTVILGSYRREKIGVNKLATANAHEHRPNTLSYVAASVERLEQESFDPNAPRSAMRKIIPIVLVLAILFIVVSKLSNGWDHSYAPVYIYGILISIVLLTTFAIALTRYKDPAWAGSMLPDEEKTTPFVTCLVAVRNEEDLIADCIDSLVGQTYIKKEIIIVNDASTDGTWSILKKYADLGLISAINLETNLGKKKALGKALLIAKGEIIAFSDSDSVLASDAISKIVDAFNSDPLIGAVSGHCRALNGDKNLITKMQDSWYEGQFSIRKAFESVFGAVTCVSGPLAAFRKVAIFNYIPAWENDSFFGHEFKFATDRTLTGFVLGSSSIGEKLKSRYSSSSFVKQVDYRPQEWKVVYCKSARALTNVPDNFSRMLKQQIRWKKSFIRNIFFTGAFYWRKPLVPAVIYYLHIFFVLLGPYMAFRHLVYLPIRGDIFSPFLYIGGIFLIGTAFGAAYQLEVPRCRKWMYRPLMSLMSTLVFTWFLLYSIATIRKMVWARD